MCAGERAILSTMLGWFSFNNPETIEAATQAFTAFSNMLLKTFVPSIVSESQPSLQVLKKAQTWMFPIFGFLINALQIKIPITRERVME